MLKQNVSLKDYSNYKIGGNASYFFEVSSKESIIDGLNKWEGVSKNLSLKKKRILVLGQGTNILFSDQGFDGFVIKNSIEGIEEVGKEVFVGAGLSFSKLVDFCTRNSLSGFEWAGGLPGTVGGAIRGNAGAFGGETKDSVIEVTSLNLQTQEIKKRNNKECNFSYRFSIFKSQAKNEIILSSVFSLKKGIEKEIENKTEEKIQYRKTKHPLEYPNLGSIFKNVPFDNVPQNLKQELSQYVKNDPFPLVPSAKLIYLAGLIGKRVGDVMVSEKHTNFIVNLGKGKALEVKELIQIIKDKVRERFGIELEEEIMYVD